MTTVDFITPLFYEVDEQIGVIPKHPEAHLWPSEMITLGLFYARKGVGNSAPGVGHTQHLFGGPQANHIGPETAGLRIVLTFTGWRNRYGPTSMPWLALPPSKGRRRSPVTLAIRVQSSRVNGLAWA